MPRRIGNPSARGQHFIKEWREFRDLTQEQLAEAIGTTKASISRIEDHLTGYTQDSLELIARVLWVHPSILLARRPKPEDALEPSPLPGQPPIPKTRQRRS